MTVQPAGHIVLASADSDVYASLRKRPSSRGAVRDGAGLAP